MGGLTLDPDKIYIYDPKYVLAGEKLVVVGRKIRKPVVTRGTSGHREQRTIAEGPPENPAKCFISKPLRIKRAKKND